MSEPILRLPILRLTDAPEPADRARVSDGIADYNEEQTGIRDSRPIAVLITEPGSGETLGGLIGRTTLGLMFIDLVNIPASLRGRRIGSAMLRMAEEEARRRGCVSAALVTISFQAPGFYTRHGYAELGRVPCHPPGTSRVFMWKALAD